MPVLTAAALLCDLDGTLVDSGPAVAQAWQIFAERHGLAPERFGPRVHGLRTAEVIEREAPGLDVSAAVAEVEGILANLGSEATPGARELTAWLPPAAWAVVTSSTAALARSRFAPPTSLAAPPVVVTAEDVEAGKPDPAAYLLAARRLSVAAAECVVLEDAPAGVAAGKAAGMTVIGVLTTHTADQLAGADHLVADPAALRVSAAGFPAGSPIAPLTLRITFVDGIPA